MEKNQEHIDIGIQYLTKTYKQEKINGTLSLIAVLITSISIFNIDILTIGLMLLCVLIYAKFRYNIKQKYNTAITNIKK